MRFRRLCAALVVSGVVFLFGGAVADAGESPSPAETVRGAVLDPADPARAADPAVQAANLARTGSDTMDEVALGVTLATAGAILAVGARVRRRRFQASAAG